MSRILSSGFGIGICILFAYESFSQTKTATVVGNSRSIFLNPASGVDSLLGPVTTYFTTFDGTTGFPLSQIVSGNSLLFSGEFRPRKGSLGVYEDDFVVYSPIFGFFSDGSIVLTLPLTDVDGNGLPDFSQKDKPGNVTATGTLHQDAPSPPSTINVTVSMTRNSGSIVGNATISSTTPGAFSTPNTTWEVLNYFGEFTYTRGSQNFGTFKITRTNGQGEVTTFSATTPFSVISQNQITFPQFFATGVSGSNNGTVVVQPTTFNRTGKKYVGNIEVADGEVLTSWPDYQSWVFEITDVNDSDGNGIPDLSDNLSTAPTISTQPQSQTVAAGASVTFSVVAIGTPPLSYQWQFNSQNIPNATGSKFTLSNIQPANAGVFRVVVRNGVGPIVSADARLTLALPQAKTPTIQIGSDGKGSLLITVTSPPDRNVTIQTSANLIDWPLLIMLPNPQGTVQFTVGTSTTARQFYRAMTQ